VSVVTNIEWADATLNLWWGCTKVSTGCINCYAEHLADRRLGRNNWGPSGIRQKIKSWRSTLNKISKRAKEEARRLRVFVQSMSDTFEGPETMGGVDSANWKTVSKLREDLLRAIPEHPEIDFLLLTKRPENVMLWVRKDRFPSNLWIGTSVENQETAEKRIPELLRVPAKFRFLSCEPLLGPVDLRLPQKVYHSNAWRGGLGCNHCCNGDRCDDPTHFYRPNCPYCRGTGQGRLIDWVIVGGESGTNARPMHPDWVRTLRDQCIKAEVPFFFKQWGEWAEPEALNGEGVWDYHSDSSKFVFGEFSRHGFEIIQSSNADDAFGLRSGNKVLHRAGKKRSGRTLDGQVWNELPSSIYNALPDLKESQRIT
jgi:protein gp37